jgi:hypothetical protein
MAAARRQKIAAKCLTGPTVADISRRLRAQGWHFLESGLTPLVTWDHVSYSSLFVPQTPLTPWSMQSPQIRVLTHGYAAAATLKAALAAPRAETASTLRT